MIRPLSEEFRRYLDADGVVLPKGSEDLFVRPSSDTQWRRTILSSADRFAVWFGGTMRCEPLLYRPAESTIEDESDGEESEEEEAEEFTFPELDSRIREVVREYGAVFPKLNFSSPRV